MLIFKFYASFIKGQKRVVGGLLHKSLGESLCLLDMSRNFFIQVELFFEAHISMNTFSLSLHMEKMASLGFTKGIPAFRFPLFSKYMHKGKLRNEKGKKSKFHRKKKHF